MFDENLLAALESPQYNTNRRRHAAATTAAELLPMLMLRDDREVHVPLRRAQISRARTSARAHMMAN